MRRRLQKSSHGWKLLPESVLAAAQSDDNKMHLRNQTEEAQRRGIFGAPTFITADGELFWGNDRLERALAWAKKIDINCA